MDLVSWTLGSKPPGDEHLLLIDGDNPELSLTFDQITTQVKQLIAGLHYEGIELGDCIMVNSFNSVQYTIMYLGIIGGGGIFTGVNPSYTPEELLHHIELTKPKLIIVEPDLLEKTLKAIEGLNIPKNKVFVIDMYSDLQHDQNKENNHDIKNLKPCHNGHYNDLGPVHININNNIHKKNHKSPEEIKVFINHEVVEAQYQLNLNGQPATKSYHSLFTHGQAHWNTHLDPTLTTAQYASTSGTSGLPKAAIIPHSYHIAQAASLCYPSCTGEPPITTPSHFRHPPPYSPRRLTALPPFHSFATPIIPASLRQGIPVVVMRRYAPSRFCALVRRHAVSETYLAPPSIVALPAHADCTSQNLASLRTIWFGGAALKPAAARALGAVLDPRARILPVWGMTEVGWITAGGVGRGPCSGRGADDTHSDDSDCDTDGKHGGYSVGTPLPGFTIRILDEHGRALPRGATGHIHVRALAPMAGYLGNADATHATLSAAGWVRTGDIGCFSLHTNAVVLLGRDKEIIKVRGFQVSPAEIEAALSEHPGVRDVAVAGAAVDVDAGAAAGEEPVAFVVVAEEGLSFQWEIVRGYLQGKLASYKIPVRCHVVPEIPRNATGKILRRKLVELL